MLDVGSPRSLPHGSTADCRVGLPAYPGIGDRMRVVVLGTGHVGLLTAATLATIGHDVVGVDSDEEKINALRQGICPFFEPGLEELIEQTGRAGRLAFEVEQADAVKGADVIFICVGTPARASGE